MRPAPAVVLAFELAAARSDARHLVREGLRPVAPAAVAAVEAEAARRNAAAWQALSCSS